VTSDNKQTCDKVKDWSNGNTVVNRLIRDVIVVIIAAVAVY